MRFVNLKIKSPPPPAKGEFSSKFKIAKTSPGIP